MIEIAPFAESHQDEVIALILPIQQNEFGLSVTLGDQPDLTTIPRFYQQGFGNFWVALSGHEVVGSIALLDIGKPMGAVRKMFVKAEYRGREHRVAVRLLETMVGWCTQNEVKVLYLGTTAQFIAAHRFYEKNSFIEIARQNLPASFPVMRVDTKFYMRKLG